MSQGGRSTGSAGPANLAGAYVGSVIGAGFASGREHAVFFLRFGKDGLWGILLAGLMLMAFGALFLVLARRRRTRNHTELLRAIAPPPVAALFDGILSLFVFSSLSVMMAGSGALLHALTGAPEALGAVGMAAATLVLLLLRVERMLQVNTLLTAVLVASILWVSGASLPRVDWVRIEAAVGIESWAPAHWPWAAALYASYNLALTFALFGALGCEIRDVKAAVSAGIGGGAALTLVGLGVFLAIAQSQAAAADPIPMLHAARRLGPGTHSLYTGAIALAMLTTTLAGSYTLTRRLQQLVGDLVGDLAVNSDALCASAVIVASLPLSLFGFGQLVATLYPLIGYVGSGCLVLAVLSWPSQRAASP